MDILFTSIVEQRYPRGKWVSGEWHSPCPICGGEDRFFVTPNGWGTCRQCHHSENVLKQATIAPEAAAQFRQQQADLEAERQQERADKLAKIARYVEQWHAELLGNPYMYEQLVDMHVPDWMINLHKFGLTGSEDGEFPLCYTFPYWKEGLPANGLASLQFRRVHTSDPKERYFFGKNLPNVPFFPVPWIEGRKVLIVVEGVKKAATMAHDPTWTYTFRRYPANVVAMPNAFFLSDAVHLLDGVLYVIWIPDPDTFFPNKAGKTIIGRNMRFVREVNSEISQVPIRLPDKLDDLFIDSEPAIIRGAIQLYIDTAPLIVGNWSLGDDHGNN